ncbi:MAG: hypothetical protein IPO16_14990 [Saprospiraceae bacterium]|nr:hypothetical protein [Saprospiraceae bacterium]
MKTKTQYLSNRIQILIIGTLFFLLFMSNLCRSQIVTGHLLYQTGYNYQPNELVEIGFMNNWIWVNVDSLNGSEIKRLLRLYGIDSSRIIDTRAYGSSFENKVEIFFAFKGQIPIDRADVWIRNQHHKFAGYAVNDILVVPQFTRIIQGLDSTIISIAKNYKINSFMVKPFNLPELPFLILAKNPLNGTLADMRWIKNSIRLVPYFKELNWQIIWFNDNGAAKVLNRPKTGWN